MSDVLHLQESECARARGLLAQFVDGDLAAEPSAWLRGHLESCVECRAALAAFAEIDCELTGWGQSLGWRNPPPDDAREKLAVRLRALSPRQHAVRWIPAAVAALAAAVTLAVIVPRHAPPAANRGEARFVEIPYLTPLDPRESATIVRMNIRVATLIAVGYTVTADPDTIVPADVLVGEDGRAHAVRVLSDIDLNGIGD